MKIICMIPSRYLSQRFEGKALADIDGKPMIQHVYERSREAQGLDDTIVVTDDDRILQAVKDFGGAVILTPSSLPTGTDRCAHAAALLHLDDDDIIVNVQGDQPRIQVEHIEKVIASMHQNRYAVMATLAFAHNAPACRVSDPNIVSVVCDKEWNAIYFSRFAIPFPGSEPGVCHLKHLGIYAYRRDFLRIYASLPQGILERAESLEQLRAIENGYKIKVELTNVDSLSVDVFSDIERIRGNITECGGGCCG